MERFSAGHKKVGMTLILGCITKDYVALASDRRLTRYEPGSPRHGEAITDNRNKNIVYCNHIHIGYTGLASIDGQRMDLWVADKLAGAQTAQEAFENFTDEATRAFKPIQPDLRGHSFLAVGWITPSSSPDSLLPAFILVSNNMNDRWQVLAQPEEHFTRRAYSMASPSECQLRWVGRGVTANEAEQHHQYLLGHVRRGGDPAGAALILANCIRTVAKRDAAVGKGILLSVLSKSAVGQPVSTSMTGAPGPMAEHNCWYIPPDDDRNNPVQYAPTYVCQGLQMHGGEVWTTKPPWWKD
jgi:hypothetical protein